MIFSLPNKLATVEFGRVLGESLPVGSTVLLEGDLGAGKTTLVQGIGLGLGVKEPIVSPTFTLINEYEGEICPLYHLDLYRMLSNEIESLAPEIYWEGREVAPGITAIEWAQRLPYLPSSYVKIVLSLDLTMEKRGIDLQSFGIDFGLDKVKLLNI